MQIHEVDHIAGSELRNHTAEVEAIVQLQDTIALSKIDTDGRSSLEFKRRASSEPSSSHELTRAGFTSRTLETSGSVR